jgi:hypothetical protein
MGDLHRDASCGRELPTTKRTSAIGNGEFGTHEREDESYLMSSGREDKDLFNRNGSAVAMEDLYPSNSSLKRATKNDPLSLRNLLCYLFQDHWSFSVSDQRSGELLHIFAATLTGDDQRCHSHRQRGGRVFCQLVSPLLHIC